MIKIIKNTCYRIIRYMSAFLLVGSTIMVSGCFNRCHSHDTSLFDAVIAQLDQAQSSRYSSQNIDRNIRFDDKDNFIQGFIDTLDKSKKSKKNYTMAHDRTLKGRTFNTSKNVINTAIDLVNQPEKSQLTTVAPQDFHAALQNFKRSRDFSQLALQQIIDLLQEELRLVHHLIAGHTGAAVQNSVDERNSLLDRTIPASLALYDTIINAVTYDDKYNKTLCKRIAQGKTLSKALTAYDQKMFLSKLATHLEQYQNMMLSIQHNLQSH